MEQKNDIGYFSVKMGIYPRTLFIAKGKDKKKVIKKKETPKKEEPLKEEAPAGAVLEPAAPKAEKEGEREGAETQKNKKGEAVRFEREKTKPERGMRVGELHKTETKKLFRSENVGEEI